MRGGVRCGMWDEMGWDEMRVYHFLKKYLRRRVERET